MSESVAGRRTPMHLWIVGVLALLLNAGGAFDYLATQFQLDFYMSNFEPAQLEYFYGFPSWVVAGWAFGVWGAFVGSIGLLLRKKWAFWSFVVSLAGMAVSSIYTMGLSDGVKIMGPEAIYMSVFIWIIAILLAVYAWFQSRNGTLR
jgi:hypothetical protein